MVTTPAVRPFRLGVMRGASHEYKPLATVGVARDGGLWIAPVDVRGKPWVYGRVHRSNPPSGAHVETSKRPKLHYHQSGIVSVTLTGSTLPHRSIQYPPMPGRRRAQLLSIVVERPWEVLTAATGPRRGDLVILEPKWPQSIGFSFSLVKAPEEDGKPYLAPDGVASGLLPDDPSRFVVDLRAHGIGALLIGRNAVERNAGDALEPSMSIVAMPWRSTHRGELSNFFGLWTAPLRNPIVWLEDDDAVPRTRNLHEVDQGLVRNRTFADQVEYLRTHAWR